MCNCGYPLACSRQHLCMHLWLKMHAFMIKNWTRTEVFGPIIILDWSDRRSSPLLVWNCIFIDQAIPLLRREALQPKLILQKAQQLISLIGGWWCKPIRLVVRKLKELRARYGRSRVIGHEMLLSRSRSSRSMGSVYLDGSASNDPRRQSPSGIDAGALHHGTSLRLSIFPSLLL